MKKLLAAGALVLILGACGSDNFRDVKGVRSQDPDSLEVYNNVDGHVIGVGDAALRLLLPRARRHLRLASAAGGHFLNSSNG